MGFTVTQNSLCPTHLVGVGQVGQVHQHLLSGRPGPVGAMRDALQQVSAHAGDSQPARPPALPLLALLQGMTFLDQMAVGGVGD